MLVGPIASKLVCIDSMLWGYYCVSYKGLKFFFEGGLAYNLRTVWATAPKLCTLADIMGPHVLHQTDLRKAAQVLPGKREKSMTSYLVSLRSISFWLCMRLPRVVKFSC